MLVARLAALWCGTPRVWVNCGGVPGAGIPGMGGGGEGWGLQTSLAQQPVPAAAV